VRTGISRPDSLTGSPLTRPAIGGPVLVGLFLIFGYGLWLIAGPVLARPEIWGVLFTSLGLALLACMPAIATVLYLDRREPEPWWLLTLTFLWGAVVATGIAVVLETMASESLAVLFDESVALVDTTQLGLQLLDPDALFTWLESSMIAPFVEEALKGLALVLLFLLIPAETNTMRDGIVYGALVGLAFAVVEATAFIISGYVETGTAEYLAELIPRFVLFGLNGHTLYSALFGAALGWARQSTSYGAVRKSLTIAGGLVLALAAHGMANAFGPFALSVFASLTGLGPTVTGAQLWFLDLAKVIATNVWAYVIILYMVIRSGYWELEVCRSELSEEVPDVVTPAELELVEGEGLWRIRRIPGFSSRRSARLVRAQNELAFRRHDVRRAGLDPDSDPIVSQWRRFISDIREDRARASAPHA